MNDNEYNEIRIIGQIDILCWLLNHCCNSELDIKARNIINQKINELQNKLNE